MTFTTAEVTRLVAGFHDHSSAWVEFRRSLLREEAVKLPDGSFAYLVEDVRPQEDSYGYQATGKASFVFRVERDGKVQHFRKNGESDSYDDDEFWGSLEEVKPKQVTVSNWEVA
jgi:hypothetical protein